MLLKILHRTIFFELVRVFLMALLGITGLLLMAGIFAEAAQHGLGPMQILAAIPLLIPSTLPYTLPATTLFATCVVYGRLAHDNEILAIKAAGVNLMQVVLPAVLLGITASAVTIGLYIDVIPSTQHELRVMVLKDVEEFLYSMLKRDGAIRHPKLNFEIHVRAVQGDRLIDAEFRRRDSKGGAHYDIIACAREATLTVDMNKKELMIHMKRCLIQGENGNDGGTMGDRDWPVDLPADFFNTTASSPREMTWSELENREEELLTLKQKLIEDRAEHQAIILQNTAPPHFAQHVEDLKNQIRMVNSQINSNHAEKHMRPALALGCLCFVLVGCPVGIWFSRSDYLSAFITCFLPIVVLYYPLLLCGINMAKLGRVSPSISIWIGNAVMAIIAAFLFRRLLKN